MARTTRSAGGAVAAGRWFVAVTITYNVIEAVIALTAVAWQLAASDPETRERTAVRIIAFGFFALAAYVTTEAVRALFGVGEAESSPFGLVLAAVSLVVMPFLSYGQRRAGRELGSRSAVADVKIG